MSNERNPLSSTWRFMLVFMPPYSIGYLLHLLVFDPDLAWLSGLVVGGSLFLLVAELRIFKSRVPPARRSVAHWLHYKR